MGCDIHAFVERIRNPHSPKDITSYTRSDFGSESHRFYTESSILDNRDYSYFYQLAGVRGRANDKYIFSEPRGLPEDVSEGIKQEYEEWGDDAHSASYATLQELIDFVADVKSKQLKELLLDQDTTDLTHMEKVIDYLKIKAEQQFTKDYNLIRIVFWFDN
jgi:hypothetical protein